MSAKKAKEARTPASEKAIKLATTIVVEVFGKNHVEQYYVDKIAAILDAEQGRRAP